MNTYVYTFDMDEQWRPALEKIRTKLRQAAKDSGMTMEEIGVAMGFERTGARSAASRLLNVNQGVNRDFRMSTLLAFAHAINRPLKDIL